MSKNRIKTITVGDKEFKLSKKKATVEQNTGGWTPKQKRALLHARAIYEAFKKTFTSTPCPASEIPGRFLAFRDTLNKRITNQKIRNIVVELVEHDYQKAVALFSTQPRTIEKSGG